jgi:hypothetical protein
MRRAVAALTLILLAVVALPAIAGAMATSQFALEPAPGASLVTGQDRLLVRPKRGATSHTQVQVTNRRSRPLTLRMDVVPVTVKPDGTASLGGDYRAVGWIRLERERVVLGPHESAIVTAAVHVPRRASEAPRTVGILAEPLPKAGAPPPAVVQRLALVLLIEPHGTASRPTALIVIALVVVLAVFGAMVILAPRLDRRRR